MTLKETADSVLEKLGLMFNPFYALSSEALEKREKTHVLSSDDVKIINSVNTVLNGETKKIIFIAGVFGSGKTEKAKIIESYLQRKKYFGAYVKVDTSDVYAIIDRVLYMFMAEYRRKNPGEALLTKIKEYLGKENLFENLTTKAFLKNEKAFAEALPYLLDDIKPFYFILDEVENVFQTSVSEQKIFFQFLSYLAEKMPEKCIMILCGIPSAVNIISSIHRNFYHKINEIYVINPLTDREVEELVKKRLEIARKPELKGRIGSLHPFNLNAIKYVNRVAGGNPRKILKILKTAISALFMYPNIEILDEKFIATILSGRKGRRGRGKIRLPKNLSKDLELIVTRYGGQPVSYLELARVNGISALDQYERLEKLRELSLLSRKGGKYYVPNEMRETVLKTLNIKTEGSE